VIIELHLCGPKGAGMREEFSRAVALLQFDNEMLIEAMLKAGHAVPDTVDGLRVNYQPATAAEARTGRVQLRGMGSMVETGTWACGDASAYEAAVQRVKHGRLDAKAYAVDYPSQDGGLCHAVYQVDGRVIDPVSRHLRRTGMRNPWENMG